VAEHPAGGTRSSPEAGSVRPRRRGDVRGADWAERIYDGCMDRLSAASLVAVAAATVVASPAPARSPREWTVYSSLPLNGVSRSDSVAIVRGVRLALAETGGMAGGHRIRFVSLNDATSSSGSWTPERAFRNARRAARDRSTVGYIGELNSGASTMSIPILSLAGVPQISPSNTAIGLTRGGPGTCCGEPGRYYPLGSRTFFRLSPSDRGQGGALATVMRDRGCRRIASITDGEVYGSGVGVWVRYYARQIGLRVVAARRIRPARRSYRRLGRLVRRRHARCVVFTGITANGAVRLFRDLGRALPGARLFGSDGIFEDRFSRPSRGGIPGRVARRVLVTIPVRALRDYPPAAQAMLDRYATRFGGPPSSAYALHGYEAMRLVLDAVAAVGPDRDAMVEWLRAVRNRDSVLGPYGFDGHQDATIREWGVYRIRAGRFVWAGATVAPE
jgi:branched-chain amino acid transport system substrate-binding protein